MSNPTGRETALLKASRVLPLFAITLGGLTVGFVRRRNLSVIYKHLTAADAVCRMSLDGVIVRANRQMRTLFGLDVIAGRSLESLFDGDTRTFVHAALADSSGEAPHVRDVRISTRAGTQDVRLEIGRLTSWRRVKGFYARLRDIAKVLEREAQAKRSLHQIFDAAPMAILTLTPEGTLTYANSKAREVVGIDTFEGRTVWDFVLDEPNRSIVHREIACRMAGGSSEYEVVITRVNDGTPTAVRVTALPELDRDGQVVGSFVIFKSIAEDKALQAMQNHMQKIETIADPRRLLDSVMAEARAVIPFDEFAVSFYSARNRQVRILYGSRSWPAQRWWTMSQQLIDFVREPRIVDDLEEFLANPSFAYLRNEPGTKEFVDAGIRSFIFRPVLRDDRVVAATTLMSRTPGRFNAEHHRLLEALPFDAVVLMALHARQRADLRFRLLLLQNLAAASNDILKMAEVLVEGLAHHYEWSNVSLFMVDRARHTLRLLKQTAGSDDRRLPQDYTQPLDKGVVGWVASTGKPVNVANVATDPRFKGVFHAAIIGTVSELCVPIRVHGRVRWLLNIEDVSASAFAHEELASIEQITNEVGELLYRASMLHFLNNVVDRASDAVVVTDAQDGIIRTNEAASTLLGLDKDQLRGTRLSEYIPELANHAEIEIAIPSATMTAHHSRGSTKEVAISASPLPEDLGGRVFIFKDRLLQLRVEQLDALQRTYYEIALQTRAPLSLIFTWLRRLQTGEEVDVRELVDRSIRQLRKVELTYDRLVLHEHGQTLGCAYNEIVLSVDEVIKHVQDQLPRVDAERLAVDYPTSLPQVRGDLFQLEFCLTSLLSYLFRLVPQDGQVHIVVEQDDSQLTLNIDGPTLPEQPVDAMLVHRAQVSRAVTDIALGEKTLRDIVEVNHRGRYEAFGVPPSRFRIDLPILDSTR
jgi:PAS domain S-box-containing protein